MSVSHCYEQFELQIPISRLQLESRARRANCPIASIKRAPENNARAKPLINAGERVFAESGRIADDSIATGCSPSNGLIDEVTQPRNASRRASAGRAANLSRDTLERSCKYNETNSAFRTRMKWHKNGKTTSSSFWLLPGWLPPRLTLSQSHCHCRSCRFARFAPTFYPLGAVRIKIM